MVKQTQALSEKVGRPLPLLLMNSYSTSQDSLKILAKYPSLNQSVPFEFLQSKIPKIDTASGRPANWPADPNLEWCPPGHGDIYLSLAESGIAKTLLEQGIKYLFVSNIDNLGATMDEKILAHFASSGAPFLMEVTRRTAADSKGGHLAKGLDGQLLLREVAQCPPSDIESFQNIEKHKFFNTNNLWLNLELIEKELSTVTLPLIVNKKTVDPKDAQSTPVVQAETAMGAAIAVFQGSQALNVPRTRFAAVKKTSDLLLVRSNLYHLDQEFRLRATQSSLPTVKLSEDYKLIRDFEERIGADLDLTECQSLFLAGDVRIKPGTKVRGNIKLENTGTEPIYLKE